MGRFLKIDAPDLADGTMSLVDVGGVEVLLARTKGKYYAASNYCPVSPQKLSVGKLENTAVICPDDHHFDLKTGRVHFLHRPPDSAIKRLLRPVKLRIYKVAHKGGEVWVESPLRKQALEMLAGIRKTEEEHACLRELYAKRIEAMKELDALIKTQRAGPERVAVQVAEGRKRVEDLVAFTDETLSHHFTMEEKVLAPVMGETLIRGLHIEHQEIWELFDKTKIALADAWREIKTADEMVAAKTTIERIIDEFAKVIETSALGEEKIMTMAKRAILRGDNN